MSPQRERAYAAVCADAHDESLREVYADLADVEGDPHGAMIRVAKRAKSDPAAERELEDLFAVYGRAAFLPLEGLAVDMKAEDGFVSVLHLPTRDRLHSRGVQHLVAACERAPLTTFRCSGAEPPKELLPALAHATNVEQFVLTEENAPALLRVRSAEIISTSNATQVVMNGHLDQIRELTVTPGEPRIVQPLIDHVAQHCHDLEVLCARTVHPALGELPKLRELKLTNVTLDPSFFTWRFPALRSLSIMGGEWDPAAIARFANAHQLESLSVHSMPLRDDFRAALNGAPLTRLGHGEAEFTYAGLSLPKLRSLNISEQGAEFHRAAGHIFDQLEELYAFTREYDGLHFAASAFPRLKRLTIEDFDVEVNRFSGWLDARPFRELEELCLSTADRGLSASFLQRAEKLEHLHVPDVQLSYLRHPLRSLGLRPRDLEPLCDYLQSSDVLSLRELEVDLTDDIADALLTSPIRALSIRDRYRCADDRKLALRRRFGHRLTNSWSCAHMSVPADRDPSYFRD